MARAPAVDWNAELDAVKSLYKRLRWPESGLGDGWRSLAYSELPRLFFLLPERTRRHIVATANGPSGAWWLKSRVVGKVPLLTGHEVIDVGINGRKLVLSLRRGGDMRKMETDHVIAATGYRVRSPSAAVSRPSAACRNRVHRWLSSAEHGFPGVRARSPFCRLIERADIRPRDAICVWCEAHGDGPNFPYPFVFAAGLEVLVDGMAG